MLGSGSSISPVISNMHNQSARSFDGSDQDVNIDGIIVFLLVFRFSNVETLVVQIIKLFFYTTLVEMSLDLPLSLGAWQIFAMAEVLMLMEILTKEMEYGTI